MFIYLRGNVFECSMTLKITDGHCLGKFHEALKVSGIAIHIIRQEDKKIRIVSSLQVVVSCLENNRALCDASNENNNCLCKHW